MACLFLELWVVDREARRAEASVGIVFAAGAAGICRSSSVGVLLFTSSEAHFSSSVATGMLCYYVEVSRFTSAAPQVLNPRSSI